MIGLAVPLRDHGQSATHSSIEEQILVYIGEKLESDSAKKKEVVKCKMRTAEIMNRI